MVERRVLVIGSQCAALQGGSLSFLPGVAEDLVRIITDPHRGGCVAALDGRALLIDPTIDEMDQAITTAVERASVDAATLLLAYIGHGEHAREDFYLLPRDADPQRPHSRSAYRLAARLGELLQIHSDLDGLVLLVDACHSGLGALEAAKDWPDPMAEAGGRFQILTSADDRAAADGCFTATLVRLLRDGDPKLGPYLKCDDLKVKVQQDCGRQVATWVAFDGRRVTLVGDEGLWLGHNPARGRAVAPLARMPAWGQVERLTEWFERIPLLRDLVDTIPGARCVALVGDAGQGKSTLAAALARAELADDLIPTRYVNALAFASPATTADDLARVLAEQLTVTVDEFGAAVAAFQRQTPQEELARLGPLERQITRPLGLLRGERPVRLVVDGLDQLAEQATPAVYGAFTALIEQADLAHVRLIVTARPDTPLPSGTRAVEVGPVAREYLVRYLRRRELRHQAIDTIAARAAGNWLVARVLADLAAESELRGTEAEPVGAELPATLKEAFQQELRRAGADDPGRWNDRLRPVLAVVSAAGVGPVLPLPLLCAASGRLGGPSRPARVRDVLVPLRGLVVRGAPGTPEEHAGVFHTTFAEFLLDPILGIDPVRAHAALADAIGELAPRRDHNLKSSLHRYAAAAEAEHLWAAGRIEEAVEALRARASGVPVENRNRWAAWAARLADALGPQHPATLTCHHEFAHWTAQAGEFRKALQLFSQLLPFRGRVLGPEHRDTLSTRHGVAYWTGVVGDFREALEQLHDLLPIQQKVLGPYDRSTLAALHDIAVFTARAGDSQAALPQLKEVLDLRRQRLGEDSRSTLTTRHAYAYVLQELGQFAAAEKEYQTIFEVQRQALGDEHPETLGVRHNLARLLQRRGDLPGAQAQLQEVLAARQRTLGADHPDTLSTRHTLAYVLQQRGQYDEAEQEYRAVLAGQLRVLDEEHPEVMRTRHNLASLLHQRGDLTRAQAAYEEVLALHQRVLGETHPETQSIRDALTQLTQERRAT